MNLAVESLLVLYIETYVWKTFLRQRKQRPFVSAVGIFRFLHSASPISTRETKKYYFNQLLLYISNDVHLHVKKLTRIIHSKSYVTLETSLSHTYKLDCSVLSILCVVTKSRERGCDHNVVSRTSFNIYT